MGIYVFNEERAFYYYFYQKTGICVISSVSNIKMLTSSMFLDFRRPPRNRERALRSSGLLCSGQWQFRTDVSGDCPETSVRNYHYSRCNNPEDHSSLLFYDLIFVLLFTLFKTFKN